nr:copia protein [Tanacetum cinerariifolium]
MSSDMKLMKDVGGPISSVCLCACLQEDPETSYLEAVKHIFRYIKGTTHLRLWYPERFGIESVVYADSDHAGDYVDQKSTGGICTFMRCCLTSWFSKKKPALAISTTEAEYISIGKACQQALWMKQSLIDYNICLNDIPIMCNNKGAIDLSKNPVQHSRIKHFEIRHHFLRDNVQKGNITIKKVSSEDNITDILTKPLKHEPFNYLRLVMEWYPHLDNGQYDIVDRVMHPLALVQEQKIRRDADIKKGRHFTSSSSAFHHRSPSHQFDDEEEIQDEVDIEKVAVCFSLRSLKPKRTIESRAKRSSKIISLGHYSIMLASSHTVKSNTDIKSPTHYPCDKMSRDVITVGSTMRIPLFYRGEYSQWHKRFMNYLEEQTDGENTPPTLKDPTFWTAEEKKTRKIDHLARSLLIQGLPNDIYSLIDTNKTAKDLWDALERQMRGFEYGEQDKKAAILYEYETFKANKGDQLFVLIFKNQRDVNDALGYRKKAVVVTLDPLALVAEKTNVSKRKEKVVVSLDFEGSGTDDFSELKKITTLKKAVVVTLDPLALVAEKTNVSKRKEKVVVSLDFEGSGTDDFSELKKITTLLAKDFNRRKFYSKPTNNNLRTSSTSQSANKKQEFFKSDDKKEDKKAYEKKREMSKVKFGSTMRIPLFYRGEYSQWRKRFMNYLEEQTDSEVMFNSIHNGDQPLHVIAQVSLAGNVQNAPPTLKDPTFWTAEEKMTRKIDHLARSLLIQGLPNDIYSLIDTNETAKDLWDALERQMRGFEYGEQDRKAVILYEYETFKANKGDQLLVLIFVTYNPANKKQEFVKSDDKKEDKKADEKKRDMSKVKCYNYKKEGHFAKDCKKTKIKDYNYYKTKMLLA